MTLATFLNDRWVAITCISVLLSVLSVGVLRDGRRTSQQVHTKKESGNQPSNKDDAEDLLWCKEIFLFWTGAATLISISLGVVLMLHLGEYQHPAFRIKAISYCTLFFAGIIAILESYGKVRDHSFRTSLVLSLMWASFVAHEFMPGRKIFDAAYYPVCSYHAHMISCFLNIYVMRSPQTALAGPIVFVSGIIDVVLPAYLGMGAEYGLIPLNVSPCQLNSFLMLSVSSLVFLAIFVEVAEEPGRQDGERKKHDLEQPLLDDAADEEMIGVEDNAMMEV